MELSVFIFILLNAKAQQPVSYQRQPGACQGGENWPGTDSIAYCPTFDNGNVFVHNVRECAALCDETPGCFAFERHEGEDTQCCLFGQGQFGDNQAGKECYVLESNEVCEDLHADCAAHDGSWDLCGSAWWASQCPKLCGACLTVSPTMSPSSSPTKSPTLHPTRSPSKSPTTSPTKSPTDLPTASPTDLPTASPTSSPETSSPTSLPTSPVVVISDDAGAMTDNSDGDDESFMGSAGFLVMLGLLLCSGVSIIGIYYYFKHKNTVREAKEQFYDLELAAIDPHAGSEGDDKLSVLGSPSCDSDLINPSKIQDLGWGRVEMIESYGSPPGTVIRCSKTVGEGLSTTETTPGMGMTPGSLADNLTDDGGLYEPAEGARRATGVDLDRSEPFVMDGNCTHPGFQSQFARRLPEIAEDGNLTHPGFVEQKNELDDIEEGPRLTHPGFLKQKNDLDDIDDEPRYPGLKQKDNFDDIHEGRNRNLTILDQSDDEDNLDDVAYACFLSKEEEDLDDGFDLYTLTE